MDGWRKRKITWRIFQVKIAFKRKREGELFLYQEILANRSRKNLSENCHLERNNICSMSPKSKTEIAKEIER